MERNANEKKNWTVKLHWITTIRLIFDEVFRAYFIVIQWNSIWKKNENWISEDSRQHTNRQLNWSRINNSNNNGYSDKSLALQQTKMIAYYLRAAERTIARRIEREKAKVFEVILFLYTWSLKSAVRPLFIKCVSKRERTPTHGNHMPQKW